MLTFIIHKQSSGGCVGKNLIKISPKALWNPDNFDDTCGWQCLAVAIYGKQFPAIKKKRGKVNKQRMEKAMHLKNLYHRLTNTKSKSNHIELSEWKAISEAFKLDIRIYMRENDSAKIIYPKFDLPNLMTGKIGIPELKVKHQGKPIRIHYEPSNEVGHYCLITSLLGYSKTKNGVLSLKCDICKQSFQKEARYQAHMEKHFKEQVKQGKKLIFDEGGTIDYKTSVFEKHFGPLVHDLYFAFDFEAMLKKINIQASEQETFTRVHEPIAVVLKTYNKINSENFDFKYHGKDADKKLVAHLCDIHPVVYAMKVKHFDKKYKKQISALKRKQCKCKSKNNHGTGCQFIATLNTCKRLYTNTPIVGFNSGKYDMTMVVNGLSQFETKYKIGDIITKGNGYMKLGFGKYQFIDAWNFCTPDTNLQKFARMNGIYNIEKDAFPYDWLDCEEKLFYKGLPPRECWFNTLKNESLSEETYNNCLQKFKAEKMTYFWEFMMYYCERDVDLLLKGWQNFQKSMVSKFQLDPNNSISGPQLSWANFLKNFKSHELKMIPNQKVYDILKNTLYGGKVEVIKKACQSELRPRVDLRFGLFKHVWAFSVSPSTVWRHEI